jgi:hypothetical protein
MRRLFAASLRFQWPSNILALSILSFLVLPTLPAHAQCNVQTTFVGRGDPRGAGIAVHVDGGIGTSMDLEVFCKGFGGGRCIWEREGAGPNLDYFYKLPCSLIDTLTWKVVAQCFHGADADPRTTSATATGGPHEMNIAPYELRAELLGVPSAAGNVRIHYEFQEEAGDQRQVLVDGGIKRVEPGYEGALDVQLLPGRHTASLRSCARPPNVSGSSWTITFDVPQRLTEWRIRITPHTRGSTAFTAQKTVSSSAVSAQIPLGAVFDVALVKSSGPGELIEPVSSLYGERAETPDLIPANVPAEIRAAVLARTVPPLFANDTLLAFGGNGAATSRTFFAAHLGTVQLTLVPLITGASPVDVDVTVIEPETLGPRTGIRPGDRRWAYDRHIIRWANLTGYPPQLLKAHADWESVRVFDPRQYRYEPLTTDWDNFSTAGGRLIQEKYAPYRLATCPSQGNLSEGGRVLRPDDTDYRSKYDIDSDRQVCPASADRNPAAFRAITEDDDRVTAYEIFLANDTRKRQNWYRILGNRSKRDQMAADPEAALSFAAQTPMAASYGIMQVMWTTAVLSDENNFRVGYTSRNPSYLSDDEENLEGGWSSLIVGTMFMKRCTRDSFRRQPPDLTSEDTFLESFRRPLVLYNGSRDYPDDVFPLVRRWYPISNASIFP